MPGTPTASHALNLFSLTMESRYGRDWRATVAADDVVGLANEIASGFGGEADAAGDAVAAALPTVWRFPDGSCAQTGDFGLTRAENWKNRAA